MIMNSWSDREREKNEENDDKDSFQKKKLQSH